MLKVGFDIRPALFDYAGIHRYVRELGVSLSQLESGPYLEMFAPSWRGGRKIPSGLAPDRYRINRGYLPGRAMKLLNRIPGLDAGRHPAKVDVFHWTDFTFPAVRSCATVMTMHDAAFAVDPTFHGWDTSNLLDRVRRHLSQADVVLVPSQPTQQDAELLGLDPSQVNVVPHGVNPFFQPATSELANSGYLLSVGTIEPRKNYPRTLRALEQCWDRDRAPDWIILGQPGWDHKSFVELMESSRHRKRITWISRTESESRLRELYQGALALLHASLHEGFGLPVLEAMACGTAVVVSENTSASWVAGDAGMLVNPRVIDSMAEGIERIVCEGWWRKHAEAVLLRRSKDFTWERSAELTHQAYQLAVERKG
jgi:glycosyltransferase involved in cell wall biosynthesis